MLDSGKTKNQRDQLSKTTGIPVEIILELVELSDLTRIGAVKKKLSRLYYDAGIKSPLDIAQYTAEKLRDHFKTFIEKSGWDGAVPNLTDLKNNITYAKQLKNMVEK